MEKGRQMDRNKKKLGIGESVDRIYGSLRRVLHEPLHEESKATKDQ